MMKIWFDMDGTIADLFGVDGWLEMLERFDTTPYTVAKPLCDMARLARKLNYLQRKGYTIGICSWTSKQNNEDFNARTIQAKKEWLAKHMPSVHWDAIYIVPYGVKKKSVCGDGILFDDARHNHAEWGWNESYFPTEIFNVLNELK